MTSLQPAVQLILQERDQVSWIGMNGPDRVMQKNDIGLPEPAVKVAVLSDDPGLREIAILVEKCAIIRRAIGAALAAAAGHAMTIRDQVCGPGKRIARLVVLNHAGNGALTVLVCVRALA